MGVSFDSPKANAKWAANKNYGFELWTDTDRSLAMHFGAASAPSDKSARRETRLLDKTGAVLLEYEVGLNLGTHPSSVLEDCQRLFGAAGSNPQ